MFHTARKACCRSGCKGLSNFSQAFPGADDAFFERVLDAVLSSRQQPQEQPDVGEDALPAQERDKQRVQVSVAEYIDTVRACLELKPKEGELNDDLLRQITEKTVWKEAEILS